MIDSILVRLCNSTWLTVCSVSRPRTPWCCWTWRKGRCRWGWRGGRWRRRRAARCRQWGWAARRAAAAAWRPCCPASCSSGSRDRTRWCARPPPWRCSWTPSWCVRLCGWDPHNVMTRMRHFVLVTLQNYPPPTKGLSDTVKQTDPLWHEYQCRIHIGAESELRKINSIFWTGVKYPRLLFFSVQTHRDGKNAVIKSYASVCLSLNKIRIRLVTFIQGAGQNISLFVTHNMLLYTTFLYFARFLLPKKSIKDNTTKTKQWPDGNFFEKSNWQNVENKCICFVPTDSTSESIPIARPVSISIWPVTISIRPVSISIWAAESPPVGIQNGLLRRVDILSQKVTLWNHTQRHCVPPF